jgi:hypothetical protein
MKSHEISWNHGWNPFELQLPRCRCKADGSLTVTACEKPASLEAEQAAAEAEHAKAGEDRFRMNVYYV